MNRGGRERVLSFGGSERFCLDYDLRSYTTIPMLQYLSLPLASYSILTYGPPFRIFGNKLTLEFHLKQKLWRWRWWL